MKIILLSARILVVAVLACNASAADKSTHAEHMMHHKKMHPMQDERISLNLPPEKKLHQLANMRSHLEAIQSIVGFLTKGEFDQASHIAHSKLGLTEEMARMCRSFGNEEFTKIGLAFHKSGDNLSEVLKSNDMNKSLQALENTLGYCVHCHATYRQ